MRTNAVRLAEHMAGVDGRSRSAVLSMAMYEYAAKFGWVWDLQSGKVVARDIRTHTKGTVKKHRVKRPGGTRGRRRKKKRT
jgi:hypothetical protein